MTNDTQIADVPHLGGSAIGYRFGRPYDPSLPTLVMVNSFVTSSALYRPQFDDAALGRPANLLAIELYGHGATRTASEQFTYWDSAIANIQVLDALKIPFAFVLGACPSSRKLRLLLNGKITLNDLAPGIEIKYVHPYAASPPLSTRIRRDRRSAQG